MHRPYITLVSCILLFLLPLSLCDYTNVRSMVHQVGPRTVGPGMMDEFEHETPDWVQTLEAPVGLVGFVVRLVGEDNSTLYQQDLYCHHVTVFSITDRNIACPEYGGYNFVAASGAEFTYIKLRYPYANRIDIAEQLGFNYDVFNPSSTDSITYYVEYTFDVADWTDDIVEVEGYFTSVTGCEGNEYLIFDVPQSFDPPFQNAFLDFESTFTGEFVYLGGHLHGGARSVYLADRGTGDIIISTPANYDDPEHPTFITSIGASSDLSYKTKIHDKLRMASIYDSTESRSAVMAILGGYVIVEEVYSGPALPQYYGIQNPFSLNTTGELVGEQDNEEITNPVPAVPPTQNNQNATEKTGDDNFTILISMIVLAFVVAAVLLVVIVGLLVVVKYRIGGSNYTVTE